ncbi:MULTISPECIES: enoyl-CoA hydratase/isomerase family protein [Rhizobium/Agrobacterium group]|uniref:enoyl-CoA hydratase/isomerase family protein n=1 Tax=Rhizobium/Agrobacterium group TaxID=227290 RepID=UPI00244B2101|nr:enoyl-CoA hydratase/isomerase family protein [Agrobacterium sp. GD03638]MDH2221622.1 enoyl-CoA hydratase/isomerase family protein [Agrobacterium sp. GD03638]
MEKPFETVGYEVARNIATITLNRPEKLNAINVKMVEEIEEALTLAETDPQVKVIIVAGKGRAFSAGFDLREVHSGPINVEVKRVGLKRKFDMIMRFWDSPKPTIAAVHGYCIGGAFELSLSCDITVAGRSASMGEPEVKFGSGTMAMLLPLISGPKVAKELLLTGNDKVSAVRAYELGIVTKVVDDETLQEEAIQLARQIASADSQAVKLTKRAINEAMDAMGLRQALARSFEIDVSIETSAAPAKLEFLRIQQEQGLKAALAWRDANSAA